MIFISRNIFSQDEFKINITTGATVFTGWQFNIDNAEFISKLDTTLDNNSPFRYKPAKNQFEISKNSFYIERAYINLKAALTSQINARLTPDIYSFTDGNGTTQYSYRIKFAFADYTPISNDNGTALSFILGVAPNQWISNIDRYFGYRFVSKSLTDYPWITSATVNGNTVVKNTGVYFSSADLGFTTKFSFPNKYGEVYASIVNGNGFQNLSFDNRFKDVQLTGFFNPLAENIKKKNALMKKSGKDRLEGITELVIGGFAYLGKLDKDENYNGAGYQRDRFGGMFNLKYNFNNLGFLKIGAELSVQKNEDPAVSNPDSTSETNARGLSFNVELCPPVKMLNEKLSLMVRYDMFDPNTADNAPNNAVGFNKNNDNQNLLIIGLFYRPAKVMSFGFSYQMTKFEDKFAVKYDEKLTDKLERLYFNTLLEF